jgi:hypothetical protein
MSQASSPSPPRQLPPTATTLSPEQRSQRARLAGLSRKRSNTGRHLDSGRALAVKVEYQKSRLDQKEEARQWLEDQVEQGRLHPLTEDQLVRIAGIIRVAAKAGS